MVECKGDMEQWGATVEAGANPCRPPAPGGKPYENDNDNDGPFHDTAEFDGYRNNYRLGRRYCISLLAFICIALNPDLLSPSAPVKTHGKASAQRASQRTAPYDKPKSSPRSRRATGANSRDKKATGGDDGNDNGREIPKPNPKLMEWIMGGSRFLACPYFKLNPLRHLNCLMRHRLTGTSFVVQHLKRDHLRQPIHCPTCGVTFDTRDQCDAHIRERTCTPRAFSYDGLTEDQINELGGNRRNCTEEERWYLIFDIVCPQVHRPDSPYVCSPLQEMSGMLRRALRFLRLRSIQTPLANWLLSNQQTLNTAMQSDVVHFSHFMEGIEDSVTDWNFLLANLPVEERDLSFLASDDPYPVGNITSLEGHGNESEIAHPSQQPAFPIPMVESRAEPGPDTGNSDANQHSSEEVTLPVRPLHDFDTGIANAPGSADPRRIFETALSPLSNFLAAHNEQMATNEATETNPLSVDAELAASYLEHLEDSATSGDVKTGDDDYDDESQFDDGLFSQFFSDSASFDDQHH